MRRIRRVRGKRRGAVRGDDDGIMRLRSAEVGGGEWRRTGEKGSGWKGRDASGSNSMELIFPLLR